MKANIHRLTALFIIICICFSCYACSGTDVKHPDTETTEKHEETIPPVEEIIETFDIISDGKLLFKVVTEENAVPETKRQASMIVEYAENNGIEITDSDKKIYIASAYYLPETEDLSDINIPKLGVDGYAIKHAGDNIYIVANNDASLSDAVNFFIENFLNEADGKTTMEENYRYIHSSGIFLSDMKIAGTDIRKFTVTADKDFEETVSYIEELVYDKCGVTLPDSAENKIILTADGATAGTVTAKVEDGNLVIRAANLEEMKKAIVCFWFETVAYSLGTYDLPEDTSYSKDLSQTVFYSDFNVTQSDSVNCLGEMREAHEYANENGLKVFADFGAKYYINGEDTYIDIFTDVEWGNAEFILDDSGISPDEYRSVIFYVRTQKSAYSYDLGTITTLSRDMTNIGITLPEKSIVTFTDNTKKQYIRSGIENSGADKRDTVVVDKDGNIDMDAPIMWDFDNITSITVQPIEEDTIYVGGGRFTTIANRAPSEYTSYMRGILVTRSNTVINGIDHYVIDEGETGAPYSGFIYVSGCAYVNVQNCLLTGRVRYNGNGSYDIGMNSTVSVTFINCFQTNDIDDTVIYHGITGTNYCKNFIYDSCVLSRIDAHSGVTNGAVKNSVMGRDSVSVVGYGTFLMENTTFFTDKVFRLRGDYGSTWEGDLIIRNCTVTPMGNGEVRIVSGDNEGFHDFGYTCYLPTNIIIDGLVANTRSDVAIFGDFNPEVTASNYDPIYPLQYSTEKIVVKNYSSWSGRKVNICVSDYLMSLLLDGKEITFE